MSNSDIIYHFFTVLLTYSIMIKFNHLFEFSSEFFYQQNFAMPPVLMRTHIVWVHVYCTASNTCTAHPHMNRQLVEFSVLCPKQV